MRTESHNNAGRPGDLASRIEQRCQSLWEAGGCEGSPDDYREEARMLVAVEDTHRSTLRPIDPPDTELAAPMESLGEFPTLTDQGEGVAYPDRTFIPEDK